MKRASYIRCEGPMPSFSGKPAPGLPPVWKVFPADHTNKPTGKIYEKPSWLEALLLMRRIARDRHMPFAAYAATCGTFRRFPPPLYWKGTRNHPHTLAAAPARRSATSPPVRAALRLCERFA